MAEGQSKDIVAIGGSAGSGAVLTHLVESLPATLRASVFVVNHVPSNSAGFLADVLALRANMPVSRRSTDSPSSAAASTSRRPTAICC